MPNALYKVDIFTRVPPKYIETGSSCLYFATNSRTCPNWLSFSASKKWVEIDNIIVFKGYSDLSKFTDYRVLKNNDSEMQEYLIAKLSAISLE